LADQLCRHAAVIERPLRPGGKVPLMLREMLDLVVVEIGQRRERAPGFTAGGEIEASEELAAGRGRGIRLRIDQPIPFSPDTAASSPVKSATASAEAIASV
jgi:hypothetical protein